MTMLNSTVQFRTFQKESCPEFLTRFSQVTSQLSVLGDKCYVIIYEGDYELVMQFVAVFIWCEHQLSFNSHVVHSFIIRNQCTKCVEKQWLTYQ